MSSEDSMLDKLMKGMGRKLGKRRSEVHQAIDRFQEEAHQDGEVSSQTERTDQALNISSAAEEESSHEAEP